MRNPSLLFLFSFLLLSFSSCENEEDPIFQPLIGQFEASSAQESNEEYVTVYNFSENGDFEIEEFLRNSETGNLIKYVSSARGKFRATESTISVEGYEFYHAPYFSTESITDKEKLEKGIPGGTTFEIHYELRDEGNEFFIPGYMVGGDVFMPDRSFKRI